MNSKLRIVAILIAICAPVGLAIKCWDCNSYINGGCGDPFDPADFAMADCSQKHLPRYPDKDGHFCRKITQKINNQLRVIRGCGYLNDTFSSEDDSSPRDPAQCVRRTGTFSVAVEYCSCHGGNGCNAAHTTVTPSIVLSTLLACLFFFLFSR